ncbi:MAG: response regulator transcription factor [Elusimicrobia bacterium]|nr:response regulator transcription factor [Elusimicrobiota bacterium]
MVRQRVLAVDDDEEMLRFYRCFFGKLHPEEFSGAVAADGREALGLLSRERLDLAVLDWMLPDISGLNLLKAIRSHPRTRSVGVIMVTALASPNDVVTALETGADDHLAKPFDEAVLLARLRSLGRRQSPDSGRRRFLVFGDLRLDLEAERLTVEGVAVHLTPKEVDLLGIFMARPNILHTLSAIWDAVWNHESEHWQHILAATISSLRRKLGPSWGPRLKSRKGRGYLFGD